MCPPAMICACAAAIEHKIGEQLQTPAKRRFIRKSADELRIYPPAAHPLSVFDIIERFNHFTAGISLDVIGRTLKLRGHHAFHIAQMRRRGFEAVGFRTEFFDQRRTQVGPTLKHSLQHQSFRRPER